MQQPGAKNHDLHCPVLSCVRWRAQSDYRRSIGVVPLIDRLLNLAPNQLNRLKRKTK
jgi:hypothetical protein